MNSPISKTPIACTGLAISTTSPSQPTCPTKKRASSACSSISIPRGVISSLPPMTPPPSRPPSIPNGIPLSRTPFSSPPTAQSSIRDSVLSISLNSAAKFSPVFPQTTLASTAIGPHPNSPLFLSPPRLASGPIRARCFPASWTHTSLRRAHASLCSLCGEFLLRRPYDLIGRSRRGAGLSTADQHLAGLPLRFLTYNLKLTTDH